MEKVEAIINCPPHLLSDVRCTLAITEMKRGNFEKAKMWLLMINLNPTSSQPESQSPTAQ